MKTHINLQNVIYITWHYIGSTNRPNFSVILTKNIKPATLATTDALDR